MGKSKPIKILTLDTETVGLHGDLRRIAIYDGKKVHYGYKFEDVEYVPDRYFDAGFDVHIYIHNLEFDVRKIDIFERGLVLFGKTKIISGKYVVVACKKFTLHDSIKIIPGSLKELSKDFDLEHGKVDLWDEVQQKYPGEYADSVDFLARCDLEDDLYLRYLGYDVISLYELVQKMIEISGIDLKNFVHIMTTASLSRYLFKNGYKGKIFKGEGQRKTDYEILCDCKKYGSDSPVIANFSDKPVTYSEIESMIRDGYYGGRTEVFIPHTDLPVNGWTALHYDRNSMYPAEMIKQDFPVGEPEFYGGEQAKTKWANWCKYGGGLGFVKAEIYVPKQNLAPLPIKRGKLVFMTGYLLGTWTLDELKNAVDRFDVEVKNIHHIIFYPHTYPVFKNFIGTMYKLKEDGKKLGKPALAKFGKLIQNTAYGWTALRRDDKTELVDISKSMEYDDNDILFKNERLGFCEVRSVVNAESIQVAVGAYVTSYARIHLVNLMQDIEQDGSRIYYCDTDSIVTDKPFPAEVVDPVRLGAWDIEKVVYEGIFCMPKVYHEVGLVNKKGVIKLDFTEKHKGIKNINYGADGEFKNDEQRQKFVYKFYNKMLGLLEAGIDDKLPAEIGREVLRSVKYTQKHDISINAYDMVDKSINLGLTQKRNMDYKNNRSEPWHVETLDDFYAINFSHSRPFSKCGMACNPLA